MVKKEKFGVRLRKDLLRNKWMYIIMIPVIAYFIIFCYKPMYGIIIAFKDYRPAKGIAASDWVGLKHFGRILSDYYFKRSLRNTLTISLLDLAFSFPFPIIFALLLNEVKVSWFKRTVQTITYMPHFISLVVVCTLVVQYSASEGLFNQIAGWFGIESNQALLGNRALFYPIYIGSGIWQGFGWSSIIYLAALSGIDQEQYEAARIDGANRFQQMRFITLPGIVPTISMLLILRVGSLISVGHEKILLLYNDLTMEVADVMSTYNYRKGLLETEYSYSTAFGLMTNVVNIILIVSANKASKKMGQSGLF